MRIAINRVPPIRVAVLVGMALLLVMLFCASAAAQKPDSTLLFMTPLVGQTWVGHYVNSPEDAHLEHVVRWDAILGGKVVKKVKAVAAVDFCEVSLYYWDARNEQVSFLSVTNRGQPSYGSVRREGSRVVMRGARPDGRSYVLWFEVLSGGELHDRFFNVVDGEQQQGHLIEYMTEAGDEYEEALQCENR